MSLASGISALATRIATELNTLRGEVTTGLAGKAATSRQISAGTGLTGGGNLTADRTLTVAYGTGAGTAVQGNEARVTADQAVGTASIRTLGTGALQAAVGSHNHDAAYRAHNQAARTQSVAANANIDVGAAGDLQVTVTAGTPTLTPTNGQNGRTCIVECLASGASRTVNIAATVVLTTGVTSRQLVIPSGKVGVFILRYSTFGTAVYELSSAYLRS